PPLGRLVAGNELSDLHRALSGLYKEPASAKQGCRLAHIVQRRPPFPLPLIEEVRKSGSYAERLAVLILDRAAPRAHQVLVSGAIQNWSSFRPHQIRITTSRQGRGHDPAAFAVQVEADERRAV